ncbi:hypothetical protein [Thiolapillus sp.]|uniref:hypothetical protein n=1 Tax=Thiolapillus sp. TaxID=2017437 RepID=UPI003AF6D694
MPNYDKFPVNYDKFPVGICVVWITFYVRHCFTWNISLALLVAAGRCWLLCRSAGRSVGRSALLLVYACLMFFCLSAGLCAALLAALLLL